MRPGPSTCNCASHEWAFTQTTQPWCSSGTAHTLNCLQVYLHCSCPQGKTAAWAQAESSMEGLWRSRGTLLESDAWYAGVNPAGRWSSPSRLELWAKRKGVSVLFCYIRMHDSTPSRDHESDTSQARCGCVGPREAVPPPPPTSHPVGHYPHQPPLPGPSRNIPAARQGTRSPPFFNDNLSVPCIRSFLTTLFSPSWSYLRHWAGRNAYTLWKTELHMIVIKK